MNILLAAATSSEIQPTLDYLSSNSNTLDSDNYSFGNHQIAILITGPGSIHIALKFARLMYDHTFDLCINAGIAGAFDTNLDIGDVVKVSQDRFADLGAEQKDGEFMDIYEMGLPIPTDLPYVDGWMYDNSDKNYFGHLPYLSSITVNKVSGTSHSIERMIAKYDPKLETMEGAGFMLSSKMWNMQSVQIRSVSNYVEPRDKSRWNIPLAIKRLNEELILFADKI